MKKGLIRGLFVVAVSLVGVSSSLAAVTVQLQQKVDGTDPCLEIAGEWRGRGIADSTLIHCEYSGTAKITGAHSARMDAVLQKTGGGIACPKKININESGSCRNGQLIVSIPGVDLQAYTDGNNMTFRGTVTNIGPMTINVHGNAHKVG